ncbi:MAG: hypothetical protein JKX72_09340 [Robiginitomaculum sp.]|nr:hypothetical protein [Robiginitomaculum sp.]
MQKIAVALKGRSNSGKTETLLIFIRKLEDFGGISIGSGNSEPIGGGDVGVIIKLGKMRIGIETQGDPGTQLKERLEYMVEQKCHIIVCATRTFGQTVEDFYIACADYERIEIHQQYIYSSIDKNTEKLQNDVLERTIDLIKHACAITEVL